MIWRPGFAWSGARARYGHYRGSDVLIWAASHRRSARRQLRTSRLTVTTPREILTFTSRGTSTLVLVAHIGQRVSFADVARSSRLVVELDLAEEAGLIS